jgi:hypothetical protein
MDVTHTVPLHIMKNKYNIHAKWLDVQLTSSM